MDWLAWAGILIIAGGWVIGATLTTRRCNARAEHWSNRISSYETEAHRYGSNRDEIMARWEADGADPKRTGRIKRFDKYMALADTARRWTRIFLVGKWTAWALWPLYALAGAVNYVYDEAITDRYKWKG